MQVIFLGLVAAMFILGVMSLLCYHIYLLMNNKTTIESFRLPVFMHAVDEEKKRGFGIGWKNNFVQVFGTKKRYWLLPVFTRYALTGLAWEIIYLNVNRLDYKNIASHFLYDLMGSYAGDVGD